MGVSPRCTFAVTARCPLAVSPWCSLGRQLTSREASVALVHLASLLVARAELRLDLDAVAHPSPGGLALKNCACRTNEPQRHAEEPVKPSTRSDIAAAIVAKGRSFCEADPRLSPEQAEARAWGENPDLYRQYCDLLPDPLPAVTAEPARFTQPDAVAAVWTEIESLAEQKRASDPSLTKEAAVSKVMSEQPALYQRYVAAGGR